MNGTIESEISFVSRAIQQHGPHFKHHLQTKGFSSDWFLHAWAAVTEIVNRHALGPRILDLGCGPGWASIFFAGRGFHVTAGDVAPDMLELARENANRLGLDIDFVEMNLNQPLPVEPGFDTVLILDALHHCADERLVLKHCFDVLRPGGKILLVEPDWFHEFSPGSAKARRGFRHHRTWHGLRSHETSTQSLGIHQSKALLLCLRNLRGLDRIKTQSLHHPDANPNSRLPTPIRHRPRGTTNGTVNSSEVELEIGSDSTV